MIGSKMQARRGFTLLIAVVLSAIALSVTLALSTLAYKGLLLSAAAQESQYAFYAADTALECALYWDTELTSGGDLYFPYDSSPSGTPVKCPTDGASISISATYDSPSDSTIYRTDTSYDGDWFPIYGNQCARFTIYKTGGSARVYAEGTNVACTDLQNPRGIVRAIRAVY